ncbi:TolC family outer membrane protein [Sulfitobacter guttiformis]|uniref:Outer membrane protein n=1 Tax=Sulfitobacter guttiformis TaxID=74349 RepID=A0A420DP33_9RHOB|nr:TolC family outer membrane protein [Sulfitobacter guttiformis]KIN73257.1 Type I secretion outer membrane protein, TolC family [Sulfitobacter guttiformis KCTC 32187]RKE95929.1 outer membrane protein [Sulfitobacter guttiformis]
MVFGEIRKGAARFARVAAVITTAAVITGTTARAETLADALVSAYNHSGLLDQNRALLRAADEDVAAAGAALEPVLRWTASITESIGRGQGSSALGALNSDSLVASGQLIADVLLYDFGATAFGIEVAKETVLATRQSLIGIEQQVLQRGVQAYMGVIEAAEFVTLRQNNVRVLTQELSAARNRFEVGEVTRTDVALAEAQLAQARSGLAGAQGNYAIAVEEYRNVIGRAPGRLSPPPSLPRIGSDIEAAKAVAVRNHPNMRAVQYQVSAAELAIKAAEASKRPTISAQGILSLSENLDSSNFNRGASIGLNAGGTLYAGGARSSGVRKAQAQRDAQRGNLHVVRHNIQQNVGIAYAQLSSARATIDASDRQITAARIAFRGVREEATLGARTTLDVLDAEQALLDAEAARISAQSLIYNAAYAVLASTGQLTARELRLPVQQYDVNEYYNLVKNSPTSQSKQGKQLDRVLQKLQK